MISLKIDYETSKFMYFYGHAIGTFLELCVSVYLGFLLSFDVRFYIYLFAYFIYLVFKLRRIIKSYKNLEGIKEKIKCTKKVLFEYDFKLYLTETSIINLSYIFFTLDYDDVAYLYACRAFFFWGHGSSSYVMKIVDKNGKRYVIDMNSFFEFKCSKKTSAKQIANIIKKHNPNVGIDI